MPNASSATVPTSNHQWDEDKIHFAIQDRGRRALLFFMAGVGPRRAADMQGAANLRVSAILKHLEVLQAAGLVIRHHDPKNGRHWLYGLAPTVAVSRIDGRLVIDFDFVALRK